MKEYWKKPEDTARTLVKGWLHTGDMAITITGDIIHCRPQKGHDHHGGENVYPGK